MHFFFMFHVESSLRSQFIIQPAHVKWVPATTMAPLLILDYVCTVRIHLFCNSIFEYVHRIVSNRFSFTIFFPQTGVTGLRVIDASISKYNQLRCVALRYISCMKFIYLFMTVENINFCIYFC